QEGLSINFLGYDYDMPMRPFPGSTLITGSNGYTTRMEIRTLAIYNNLDTARWPCDQSNNAYRCYHQCLANVIAKCTRCWPLTYAHNFTAPEGIRYVGLRHRYRRNS